ncbi:MAG: DUF397 domain-containing protein [Streptosporangiaceae bacterium]|nr:DUF397 domain-containing protein [Streptosporangiaceae bacterium]
MEDTDLKWRKASYSSNGGSECVEVGEANGMILVRDTKDRSKAPHRYTVAEWRAFVAGVRDGEFDVDDAGRLP